MKNHLKRLTTPSTWLISRKSNVFITRPNAGAHSFEQGLPLGVVLRDIVKIAQTSREVQKILNNNDVLVDGKRRKDHRFIIGLFDVLSIPSLKKHFRVILDGKGRLRVPEISEKEAGMKVCKVVGKTLLSGGKMQYNLHDGKNILSDEKAKVGDSLVIHIPSLKVQEVLHLQKSSSVFLTKGKHAGSVGQLKEIAGTESIFTQDGTDIRSATAYLFVVGKQKSLMELKND